MSLKLTQWSAYERFCALTVVLVVAGFLLALNSDSKQFAITFNERPASFAIAVVVLAIIAVLYAYAHSVVWRLSDDDAQLRLFSDALLGVEEPRKRAGILNAMLAQALATKQPGAITRAFCMLATRHRVAHEHNTGEPINRKAFEEIVMRTVARGTTQLERAIVILFFVGILGSVLGIFLSYFGQQTPVTFDEVQKFNFQMLSGLGMGYMAGVLGLSGCVILTLVKSLICEPRIEDIADRLSELMFTVVFPVLHAQGAEE